MSIRETILSQIEQITSAANKAVPALTDDVALVHSGLDSLGMAILVTKLEDSLGLDPFSEAQGAAPPVTVGDFIRLYENAANAT